MRQRVADLFDDGLVEVGFGARDLQPDVLAEVGGDVANDALEAVEGGADLHHAQRQRRVAHFLDQPAERGDRFEQLGDRRALGDQAGAGAGDDQFADQVDVLVELVGIDADQPRLGRFVLLDLFLLVERRADDPRCDQLLLDQYFAELRLRRFG